MMQAWPVRSFAAAALAVCAMALTAHAQSESLSQPSRYQPTARQPAINSQPAAAPTTDAEGFTSPAPAVSDTSSRPEGDPLSLSPPRQRTGRELIEPRMPGRSTSMSTVVGSLAVVLGMFFVLAWFLRRTMPQAMTRLPGEVVEQLGRTPLGGKQNMHLVRVGSKLLLVVVTPFGAETLTEITDVDEVDRLTALCRRNGSHGPTAEFREVLREFEREPARGFLGNTDRSDVELALGDGGRSRRRGGFDA